MKENLYKTEPDTSDTNPKSQKAEIDCFKIQLILKLARCDVSNSKLIQDIKQIDKDIERTGYMSEIEGEAAQVRMAKALRNILITFATFNQNLNSSNSLGYTQGYLDINKKFLGNFKNINKFLE